MMGGQSRGSGGRIARTERPHPRRSPFASRGAEIVEGFSVIWLDRDSLLKLSGGGRRACYAISVMTRAR